MTTIRAAVGLLTRWPVRVAGAEARTGAAAFPLVGAAIGGLAAIVCLVLGPAEPTVAALLAVGVMALVSGGLHLDGLADTVDALLAPDPARAELARRDPRIGAGGAAALILVLGTQVAALASLASSAATADGAGAWLAAATIVVAAAAARAVPVVGAVLAARGDGTIRSGGFGAWFVATVRPRDAAIAAATVIALVAGVGALVGSAGLVVGAVIGLGVGCVVLAAVRRQRGGLDGDGLGATIELTVAAILVTVAVLT